MASKKPSKATKPADKPEPSGADKPGPSAAELTAMAEDSEESARADREMREKADADAAAKADAEAKSEAAAKVETAPVPPPGHDPVAAIMAELHKIKVDLQLANDKLDELMSAPRSSGGSSDDCLAMDEVKAILKQDSTTSFRVIEDFKHMSTHFGKGRVVQGRRYKHFVAFVGSGLKVIKV